MKGPVITILFFTLSWFSEASSETCTDQQYQCDNGQCIHTTWRCDREKDCQDGSDEINCGFLTCPPSTFRCGDGVCVPEAWKCDGADDCSDGSDENDDTCGPTDAATCPPSSFQCEGRVCVPGSWKCDGEQDCTDGSDESDETCGRNTAVYCHEFYCPHHGPCISSNWRCDGEIDCPGGEDEQGCVDPKLNQTCHPVNEFQCAPSACISIGWRCDGDQDCADNSDEIGCDGNEKEDGSNNNSTDVIWNFQPNVSEWENVINSTDIDWSINSNSNEWESFINDTGIDSSANVNSSEWENVINSTDIDWSIKSNRSEWESFINDTGIDWSVSLNSSEWENVINSTSIDWSINDLNRNEWEQLINSTDFGTNGEYNENDIIFGHSEDGEDSKRVGPAESNVKTNGDVYTEWLRSSIRVNDAKELLLKEEVEIARMEKHLLKEEGTGRMDEDFMEDMIHNDADNIIWGRN